ncbi:MAG: hypothetical protein ACTHXA_05070 [Gulosibacter sp.]|uniref:hypothetical protein n=1 Tax=Gulosibacter sp. TaxID=2817531 RepID=UPI003F9005B2
MVHAAADKHDSEHVTARIAKYHGGQRVGEATEVEMTAKQYEFIQLLSQELDTRGDSALDGVDVTEAVERAINAIPSIAKSDWDELVGPFYTTPSLTSVMDVSRQWLATLRKRGRLLATATADGTLLYPSFQFGPSGQLLPHLDEVQRILRDAISDPWTIALWLNTELEEHGGKTAAELLRGEDAEIAAVIDLAREDVQRRNAA